MQFDSSYITTAGSELLARATASNNGGISSPIVWGSVYTSKRDMRSLGPEEMRALTSISENERSSSGSVTSARHDVIDGNHIVKLECEINNRQYHGSAYAIGIYAKLDSDSNEVLAAIARVDTNGSTPDIIQQSGEYLAIIDFAIAIRDDQFNIQKVDSSYYASAKSMQDLASRVVTTHVESDVTVGEDQEIRGNKYFQNGIMLNGQDGRPCIQLTDVYGRQDIAYEVGIHTIDRGLSIVAGNHLFNDTDRIFMMELDNGTALFDTTRQRASFYVPELYVDTVNTNSLVTETDSIILKSNITPSDATVTIGTTDNRFNEIYATNINATNVNANFVTATDSISTDKLFSNTLNHEKITTGSSGTEKQQLTTSYNKVQFNYTKGVAVGYSTMWMSGDRIMFTAGPHGNETGDDYTLMSMSIGEIQVRQPLTLFGSNITIPSGKVSIQNGYQIACGIPLEQRMRIGDETSKKFEAIGIGDGCLIGAYDTLESFTGSSAIKHLHPGTRIIVRKGRIHLAMCAGAVNESAVNSWYPCGHNTNYSSPTGIEDLYLPEGQYVTCTGAVAQQSTSEYVFVLLLRVA